MSKEEKKYSELEEVLDEEELKKVVEEAEDRTLESNRVASVQLSSRYSDLL